MLALLLDEQISPDIAIQIRAKRPDIPILSLMEWRNGTLVSSSDRIVLVTAAEDDLTLVTFDLKTIPSLLIEFAHEGISHAGVIFVDEKSIYSNEFGAMIQALMTKWDVTNLLDWANRIDFLRRT